MREQLWLLPSGDAAVALRATVFRPAGAMTERHPLVVINHGTSESNRMSVSMPVYYWLSRWFVDRGYAVVLPQRRGHGATGGTLVESVGDCANPDHYRSGVIAAQDVGAAVDFMARQPFVDPTRVLVVGVSTGGWASLALASQRPDLMAAVVNIAGGRGGHAWGRKNSVCGAERARQGRARICAHGARTDAVALCEERQLLRSGAGGQDGGGVEGRRRQSRIRPAALLRRGRPRHRRRSCRDGTCGARASISSSPPTSAWRRSRRSRRGRRSPRGLAFLHLRVGAAGDRIAAAAILVFLLCRPGLLGRLLPPRPVSLRPT